MSKTIEYYNQNAEEFFASTVNADMTAQYDLFEKYLKIGDKVLDCGCGSGRDSKHFLDKGYSVTAIDASEELCKKASELTGINVRNILFQDIDYIDEFDGIWACASLLHVDRSELQKVMSRLYESLHTSGVMYVSFKYGDYNGERNGRVFTDLTEKSFGELIALIPGLEIIETTITSDVRPGRDEKWLNAIVKKNK